MAETILGVSIDTLSTNEALAKVRGFLDGNRQATIFTPNPEMLVKAQSDAYFRTVLNAGDLNLCDGFGLSLAVRIKNYELRIKEKFERITGVDFMLEVCRVVAEQGKSVFLLGSGDDNVLKQTAYVLVKRFPGLKVVGVDKGLKIEEIGDRRYEILGREAYCLSPIASLYFDQTENERLISHINELKPAVLFVAFGMGKQEKWIYENLAKLPSVKIAMGVGGAFDFISGKVKRAPLLLRKFGLEWGWRLALQPGRFVRIFNATIKFSYLVLRYNFKALRSNVK